MKSRKWKIATCMSLIMVNIFVLVTLSPTVSYACSCAGPAPVDEEVERSAAVFRGTVVDMEDKNRDKLIQSSGDPIAVRFNVEESWKGINDSEITVYTERFSASCGYEFEVTNEYLVYAHERNGDLVVNLCSRTAILSEAESDLQELGEGTKPMVSEGEGRKSSEQSTDLIYPISLILLILLVIFYFIRRGKRSSRFE